MANTPIKLPWFLFIFGPVKKEIFDDLIGKINDLCRHCGSGELITSKEVVENKTTPGVCYRASVIKNMFFGEGVVTLCKYMINHRISFLQGDDNDGEYFLPEMIYPKKVTFKYNYHRVKNLYKAAMIYRNSKDIPLNVNDVNNLTRKVGEAWLSGIPFEEYVISEIEKDIAPELESFPQFELLP